VGRPAPHLGHLHGTADRVDQRSETALRRREHLMLDIPKPPRFYAIESTKPAKPAW
jgi:hypothetical protein